jgi:hypothetical protein
MNGSTMMDPIPVSSVRAGLVDANKVFDNFRAAGLQKIATDDDNSRATQTAHWRIAYMNALKIVGVVLIAAGILGLVYGSFSFTKETHEAKLGPLELQLKEKETVNVPVWAGVGAIVVGGILLLVPAKR